MSPQALNWLTQPWQLPFMQRAALVLILASVVCAVVGTYVVLRGMAFIGDAVAHAVFPGVATAYLIGGNLLVGGAIAGVAMALGVGAMTGKRLREDSIIGVLFVGMFALGVVMISARPGYAGDLESFLFGQVLGIGTSDVWTIAVVGAIVVSALLLLRKELVACALDRETAKAMGLRVVAMDIVLYVAVALAVVASLKAVGNILVVALLVTPAATARLLTDRLGRMMILAAILGAVCSIAGLYISYYASLATGGMIVLTMTAVFLLAWVFSPKHGLVVRKKLASA